MTLYRAQIASRSAFATPLRGDTLFGHLCWAVRQGWGEDRLTRLLGNYANGEPFAVLSDPFPVDKLPRPRLPRRLGPSSSLADRKAEKRRGWGSVGQTAAPVAKWQFEELTIGQPTHRSHNSIDRRTGTTGLGEDGLAPFSVQLLRYVVPLDIYVLVPGNGDFSVADLQSALSAIGTLGYGADASTGAGRFDVGNLEPAKFARPARPNAWLTLAPCAPPPAGELDARLCWYSPLVRFGKHGNIAGLTARPWKNPLLLADTAAILTPTTWRDAAFVGQGLGSNGKLSRTANFAATVHQGYAPVVAVDIDTKAAS